MKTLATMTATITGLVPAAAFAAATEPVAESGIFAWIFLGFCALIILLQTLPAILLMTGLVKGVMNLVSGKVKAAVKKP